MGATDDANGCNSNGEGNSHGPSDYQHPMSIEEVCTHRMWCPLTTPPCLKLTVFIRVEFIHLQAVVLAPYGTDILPYSPHCARTRLQGAIQYPLSFSIVRAPSVAVDAMLKQHHVLHVRMFACMHVRTQTADSSQPSDYWLLNNYKYQSLCHKVHLRVANRKPAIVWESCPPAAQPIQDLLQLKDFTGDWLIALRTTISCVQSDLTALCTPGFLRTPRIDLRPLLQL